jgi:hypothetical protein
MANSFFLDLHLETGRLFGVEACIEPRLRSLGTISLHCVTVVFMVDSGELCLGCVVQCFKSLAETRHLFDQIIAYTRLEKPDRDDGRITDCIQIKTAAILLWLKFPSIYTCMDA